jgi:hypothetical protein
LIITPERLTDLATEEVKHRAKRLDLVAGYLVGSVVRGEPLLGGCADIDLILIHSSAPLRAREIKKLSPEVHLDIFHKSRQDFENPRELRTDPGLGCGLCGSLRLYDPDHFFDWVQAAACAQFTRSDNRMARALSLLEKARQGRAKLSHHGSLWPSKFVQAAWDGANALCCLRGKPVHGRRAVLRLQGQLEELEAGFLFANFLHLFQVQDVDEWNMPNWLTSFGRAFNLASELDHGATFKTVRRDYYLKAFQALAESGQPEAALISLLTHWPLPISSQDPLIQEVAEAEAWQGLRAATGLTDEMLSHKQRDLEKFLDQVELFIEKWGAEHGA